MRRIQRSGSFVLCLLVNMFLNMEGLILAIALLVLHFVLKWPVWWSLLAFSLWVIWLIFWMLFTGWAGHCSNIPDPPKQNKNPYSVGNKKDLQ